MVSRAASTSEKPSNSLVSMLSSCAHSVLPSFRCARTLVLLAGHEFSGSMVLSACSLLVQHMERIRVNTARSLQQAGEPVLDPPPADWVPLPLTLPAIRGDNIRNAAPTTEESPDAGVGEGGQPRAAPRHPLDPDGWSYQPLRLLVGPPGIGKTVLLNYAVHYGVRAGGGGGGGGYADCHPLALTPPAQRTNGWLTLYVPDPYWIMAKGLVLVASRARPGLVDQHDVALRVLEEVRRRKGGEGLGPPILPAGWRGGGDFSCDASLPVRGGADLGGAERPPRARPPARQVRHLPLPAAGPRRDGDGRARAAARARGRGADAPARARRGFRCQVGRGELREQVRRGCGCCGRDVDCGAARDFGCRRIRNRLPPRCRSAQPRRRDADGH